MGSNLLAKDLIKAFGGVRAMGRAIKISPSAISRWAHGKPIPLKQWRNIIIAAKKANLKIDLTQFLSQI